MSTEWPSLRTLELLVAISEHGSVAAGARAVGMAQPNASRRIVELEAAMCLTLLRRTPRGSAPTEAAAVIVEHARAVLAEAEVFLNRSADPDQAATSILRVGSSMTIAEELFPRWLAGMRLRAPEVRVDLRVLNSVQVADQVRDGELQLGFVESPDIPVGLNGLLIQEDELLVVVAPGHPWSERCTKLGLEELAHSPLVVREPGSGTREVLDGLLADLCPVEPAMVLQSNAAVRILAVSGYAPAVLSKLAVRAQLATGQLLEVPLEEPIRRPLAAVWMGPKRLTGAAAELIWVARHGPTGAGGA